ALIPGIISVALIFLLKEKRHAVSTLQQKNLFSFFQYWNIASTDYKHVVTGLLLFALFNSSDIFLLLKTKEISGSDNITLVAYIFYNFVFALASYPMGMLGDRIGLKTTFLLGLILFTVVYFMFGSTNSTIVIIIAFFLYGVYAAATEGIAKAWLTNMAHNTNTATAVGFYTSCQSICSLLASVIAGMLWSSFSSSATFFTTSISGLSILAYFQFCVKKSTANPLP
ncbi:MAG: MFS transporter, partial [Chitinophagaceae bacterium]|nr:MFS transporter [Chitinophagaceae bacterium]